jgi:hypothetical protein
MFPTVTPVNVAATVVLVVPLVAEVDCTFVVVLGIIACAVCTVAVAATVDGLMVT